MRSRAPQAAAAPTPAPPVDPSQFGELYEANFERVYAFVARRVKGREEIEDLTSDVFRRALAGVNRFENRGVPFSAWLLRIAANAVIDRARRASRKAPPPEAPEPSEPECLDAETRARLFRAVAALPADQRRVIELRFAEERSIAEIAAALGRTEGAVKQLQLRALRGMRKRMNREDG
jgi:RNA polymerase sigma-70 factor, ECF subfamily